MKISKLLFLLSLLFLISSCSNDDDDASVFELNKKLILIGVNGGNETVQITSNQSWQINVLPNWMRVSDIVGENSAQITLLIEPNMELENRKDSILFVSDKIYKYLVVEQLGEMNAGPYIALDPKSISVSTDKSIQYLKVTANEPWKINSDLPDWLKISPMSGEKSAELTVYIDENKEPNSRGVNISFASIEHPATANTLLTVSQWGPVDIIRTPNLPIFKYVSITSKGTSKGNEYDVQTYSLFVNKEIRSNIYLGNLISRSSGSNIVMPAITGFTFQPIAFTYKGSNGDIKQASMLPSISAQNEFIEEVDKTGNTPNVFIKGYSNEFYSYRDLYAIGMFNLGIKLDELVTGASYKAKTMTRKFGVIYSFKNTLFTLTMDKPATIPMYGDLKDEDKSKQVSNVSTMAYGRIGLLVVETDTYYKDLVAAIDKILEDKILSAAEQGLIEQSQISYVYFDNDSNPLVKKGKRDVIDIYKNAMNSGQNDNYYPIDFRIGDYFMSVSTPFMYTLTVPK